MDSSAVRAILDALAECWPEQADVEKVEIRAADPQRIVVTVWTSRPGEVIGRQGISASGIQDRLRAVAPDKSIEFRVAPGSDAPTAEDGLWEMGATLETGPAGRDLVPDLVGMTLGEAHAKARSSGFSLTTGDPDGVPITFHIAHQEYGHWVVIGQSPVPGVLAPLHSAIVVAIEERGGGGESGDREPREPRPPHGIVYREHPIDDELQQFEGVEFGR